MIENNLVMLVKASTSLLNTDLTPAAFWLRNPNNVVRGNHAAGSEHYGFWLNFPQDPDDPVRGNVEGAYIYRQ